MELRMARRPDPGKVDTSKIIPLLGQHVVWTKIEVSKNGQKHVVQNCHIPPSKVCPLNLWRNFE
jgi:hypothetical protein